MRSSCGLVAECGAAPPERAGIAGSESGHDGNPLPLAQLGVGSGAGCDYLAGKLDWTPMKTATQLAIFLANQPGALARVCTVLAEAGINILALTTSDTVDHSVVRMVVSEPRKAISLLEEPGLLVVESEVLLLTGANQPGALAEISNRLARAKVNIDYCASSSEAPVGLLVLRVNHLRRARQVQRGVAAVQ